MSRKIAIVLRGPTGVGKSCVMEVLAGRLNPALTANLDGGWGASERRCRGLDRYCDLRAGAEIRTIIIELAWGEPTDVALSGATRNPEEWWNLLEHQGFAVHSFLLMAEKCELKRRVERRAQMEGRNPWGQFEDWILGQYTDGGEACHRKFCERIGVGCKESVISIAAMTVDDVAEEILRLIGA